MLRRAIVPTTVLAAAVLGLSASAASATVTQTQITSPGEHAVIVVEEPSGNPPVTVTGVAPGASNGDKVDIDCFGDHNGNAPVFDVLKEGVEVQGEAFSFVGSFAEIDSSSCLLVAVPTKTKPVDLTPFKGPHVAVDALEQSGEKDTVQGGPNNGDRFEYFFWGAQFRGTGEFFGISSCGICDTYPYDPSTDVLGRAVFFANAALFDENISKTRSEIQVDGHNAFTGESAAQLVNRSTPTTFDGSEDFNNFPAMTDTVQVDPTTGNVVIHEEAPFVVCAKDNPFSKGVPASECEDFVPSGVRYSRTFVQNEDGQLITVIDNYSSTDGRAHNIDLLYFQSVDELKGGPFYEEPWIGGGFSEPTANQVLGPPPGPATIFTRQSEDANEETEEKTGAGALTMSAPPGEIAFGKVAREFELHYTRTVPASGSVSIGQAFSTAFDIGTVRSLAATAMRDLSPQISISSPATGATLTASPATVAGKVQAGGNGMPATVSVGDQSVPVAADGTFTAAVGLSAGSNTITASTADQFGLSASAAVTVTYAPPPPAPVAHVAKVSIAGRSFNGKELKLKLACKAGGARCIGTASLTIRVKLHRKHKTIFRNVTIAKSGFSIAAGSHATVVLKLSRAADAKVHKLGKLATTLHLTIKQAHGTTSSKLAVTLHRPKHKPPRHKH